MMKNAEAAILQSEGSKFEDWGVKKMVLLHFCTSPPLLLLMTHHEETQLNALP